MLISPACLTVSSRRFSSAKSTLREAEHIYELSADTQQASPPWLLVGMEPLGKVSAPAHALRKDEEGLAVSKGPALVASGKSVIAVTTGGTPSPKALPGKPARERDRLSFFSSLKRKVSGGEQANVEENGDLHRQVQY